MLDRFQFEISKLVLTATISGPPDGKNWRFEEEIEKISEIQGEIII